MGLDGVELVMETEDEFSITITDDEAEACKKVGDLHRLVCHKLGMEVSACPECRTRTAFYEVRHRLARLLGRNRRDLRPDTRIVNLIPPRDRRRIWSVVPGAPRLVRSGKTPVLILVSGILVGWLAACIAAPAGGAWVLAAFCAASGATWLLLVRATRSLAVQPPPGAETVGDLARRQLDAHRSSMAEGFKDRREAEVWRTVQEIVAAQLGQPLEKVTPEARFVDDLGLV